MLEEAKRLVNSMASTDLHDLSVHVRTLLEQRTRASVRIGDLADCTFSNGETIRFRVERINTKTVSGREIGPRKRLCRAPPSLCRLVGGDRPAAIPAARPLAPVSMTATGDDFGAF